jgi:DNA-binding XRE family transcriptional regulator
MRSVGGGHTHAVSETQWERLYRLVEQRRRALGLTLPVIQSEGGPSPRWVQNLRTMSGAPSPRMRASLTDLDRALQWPDGTSWSLVADDRSDWTDHVLHDEEEDLLAVRGAEPHSLNARKQSPLSIAVADQLRAERAIAKMTVEELSRKSGVSKRSLEAILTGKRTADVIQLDSICRALGVPLLDLFMRAEERLRSNESGGEGRPARHA